MARILSVVHAIQPWPGSTVSCASPEPCVAAGVLEARRSSSSKGMS